jgi:hypothetical protein
MRQQHVAKRNREHVRLYRERKRQKNTCVKYENKKAKNLQARRSNNQDFL